MVPPLIVPLKLALPLGTPESDPVHEFPLTVPDSVPARKQDSLNTTVPVTVGPL